MSSQQQTSVSSTVLAEKSVRGMRWVYAQGDSKDIADIAAEHDIDETIARLLVVRGVKPADASSYLKPTLRDLMPDPLALTDMDKAVERLSRAIMEGETIGVFGDYDVDGVTASSLLFLYMRELDVEIEVYLPDRVGDGYGPSIAAFENLRERGANIIITVDCGASAHDPIEAAGQKGIDVVVIDHHLMTGPPPQYASGVVNPNRPDDLSGLTNLSAAGVAFMVLAGLNRALHEKNYFEGCARPDLLKWLDIVALGLVCDVMQVKGLTRAMIAQGLRVLSRQMKTGEGGNPGLASLARRAGVKGQLSPYHLGFLLGPRINAAGRIGHANMAFDLITTPDKSKRDLLSERLHVLNAERQAIEAEVLEQAISQIEQSATLPNIIIAKGLDWHQGVVGIVAGRLKERYDRPVIAISLSQNDSGCLGKGSGRSISGVDLGGAIIAARENGLLVAGGGHAMAAGLTIAEDQLEPFADFLEKSIGAAVIEARANRSLSLDGIVSPLAVSGQFATMIENAGPFGPGNAEPVFMLEAVTPIYPKVVGEAHLACTLRSDTGEEVRAIAFRVVDEPLGDLLASGERLNLAGKIKVDDWRGGNAGQFQIVDGVLA